MRLIGAALITIAVVGLVTSKGTTAASTDPLIERGHYLVAFGGCNDCHTPGWRESDGRIPMSKWMTGSDVGWRGAWGTVYPVNVRLWFQETSEDDWLFSTRTRGGLPPMQWHDIRFLNETDRRAIYRFIRSLGPAGKPAPHDLPPWQKPKTPYMELLPQQPEP
ncbi:MAG TPA: hypothetical protein VKT72_00890 [Candidatus Baltobacteraceae bacterium]|nr:hypothetical protein [Candidatus Baltobacteraceae bacterium]